eukprot:GHVN01079741.1.p1 GENE.GHVN01079741.1~~GHVN01079741.1.p1  ORF type:complete len:509 (-),score=152.49 GHVN01079741.1:1725-3251(-)
MEKTAISSIFWLPRGVACPQPQSHVSEKCAMSELKDKIVRKGGEVSLRETWKKARDKWKGVDGDEDMTGEGGVTKETKKTFKTKIDDEDDVDEGDDEGGGEGTARYGMLDIDDENESDGEDEETREKKAAMSIEERFEMDKYDDEDLEDFDGRQFFNVLENDLATCLNDKNLVNLEDSEEDDANEIYESDHVLVAASAHGEASTIEVYVYDEVKQSLYVHHDILVGGFPLCLERVSAAPSVPVPGQQQYQVNGNLVALGAFEPVIQIWDLDVTDRLDPVAVLGVPVDGSSSRDNVDGCHTDAVMALHSSPHRPILASASADSTVCLWDLTQGSDKPVHKYTHHSDKVQSCRWHPSTTGILLTASFDGTGRVMDVRDPKTALTVPVGSDAEAAMWDSTDANQLMISCENGWIMGFDQRRLPASVSTSSASSSSPTKGKKKKNFSPPSECVWSVRPSSQPSTGIATVAKAPGLMITTNINGHAYVWNTNRIQSDGAPHKVFERDLKAVSA